jgi:hypothetical protein
MAASPRTARAKARGNSLVEVIAAVGVMLVGAAGVAGLNRMGLRADGDGRRITRATAIAEDLAQQLQLWPYGDPRLANVRPTNDDDIGDTAFALEQNAVATGFVDHGEASLTLNGAVWNGIPSTGFNPLEYERYWNVSFNDPAAPGNLLDENRNGVADGMRIAVIVRYRNETGWRRVVLLTTKVSDRGDR